MGGGLLESGSREMWPWRLMYVPPFPFVDLKEVGVW
jgi:hypothetical protein